MCGSYFLLQLGLELILRHAFAHRGSRRDTACDGLHQVVHIIGTTPLCEEGKRVLRRCKDTTMGMWRRYLLVSKNVAADLALLALNQLDVGLHTFRRKRPGEQIVDVGVRMKSSELQRRVNNKQ